MKIIILNNLYDPYTRGGAEVISQNLAQALYALGHEVTVVTTKPYFKHKGLDRLNGIRVIRFSSLFHNLKSIPKGFRLIWHLFDILALGKFLKLRKVIKSSNPDLVITNNLKGLGYSSWLAGKSTGARLIHILHDISLLHPSGLMYWNNEGILDTNASRIYQAMNRSATSPVDIVVSPSAWLLGLHQDLGFFKKAIKQVLPNPAPPTAEKSFTGSNAQDVFRFIYIGQLEEHKGIKTLMRSFRELKEKYGKQVELVLLGTGSLAEDLVAEVKNGVRLYGYVEHAEAMRILSGCDCLVLPSKCYENSPTVIYEALCSGVEVLASRIGGIPELVDDAMLFEPENTKALLGLMEKLFLGRAVKSKKNTEFDSASEYAMKILELLGE